MPREFDTVLDHCLDMLGRGAGVEDCLSSFPQHAASLEPLLTAAVRVHRLGVPPPSPEAFSRGEQALVHAIEQAGARPRWRFLPRSFAPLAAAATLAAVALIALVVVGPLRDTFEFGTETAVADGTITTVGAATLEIETEDGTTTVLIDGNTQIHDRSGSRLDLRLVTPGTEVRIRGEVRDDGSIAAERIEVRIETEGEELEFEGQVASLVDGMLTVTTPAGDITVAIGLDAELDGDLLRGASVKVKGIQQADGSVIASRIEVRAPDGAIDDRDEDEDEDDGHDDSSGPGSSGSGTSSGR